MGHAKKRASASTRKSARHILPHINLSEEPTNISNTSSIPNTLNTLNAPSTSRTTRSSTINIGSDKWVAKSVDIESRLDIFDDDDDTSPDPEDHLPNDDENLVDDFTLENEMTISNCKRKVNDGNDMENEDINMQKKIRKLSLLIICCLQL